MLRKIILGVVVMLGLMGTASAQSLDALRANGSVGERFDGLAVARDPAAADFVAQVNRQRLQIYRDRAAEQQVTVEQVGEVYARQIVQTSPKGTWFQDRSGQWRR
ncbi:YdbL family protein [Minwuia sp.]|uniref:YdbL family protein n=1 Tax=Minwuia sp. TaxID=2493630 RepID=UPI003A8D5414